MQRKFFFIVCFVLTCTISFAQQYPFFYYTPKDGLVNSRIKSVWQDSRGFMYFITLGGLSVYDGARFMNYSQENGLANELVNDVAEMAPDSLLVATNVAELNTLVRGKVGVFKTADNFCPTINRFFKSRNGMWYIAADEGLFVLLKNRFVKISVMDRNGKEIGRSLDHIVEWRHFLILTPWDQEVRDKLIVYDMATHKLAATEQDKVVYSMAVSSTGQLLITTDAGLSEIDTASLMKGSIIFNRLPMLSQQVAGLKHAKVYIDKHGGQWFFDSEGFYKVTSDGVLQSFTSGQGLRVANLTGIFIDKEGNTWIATDGNGVAKLSNSGLELIDQLDSHPATVLAIARSGDTLWAYNNNDNAIYRICENDIVKFPLPNPRIGIINIHIVNAKMYLIGQHEILCVNNKNDPASFRRLDVFFHNANTQFGNGVIDQNGNFIIEENRNGKSFYTSVIGSKGILYQYHNETIADQLAIDDNGRLWLITRNDQLLLLSLHPENPSQYLRLERDYSRSIPRLGPRSIMVDKNDNVWIGTRYNDIYYFQFRNALLDTIMHFTTKDGLTDNFVYALTSDTMGRVWAGTQTGLDKIFFKNGKYIIGNVSRSNGLYQSIRMIAVTHNSTVWALPNEGPVIKISPGGSYRNVAPAGLYFTELKLNDSLLGFDKNKFRYNQNNFSFSVAAPSFIDEKSIRYSYLLAGSGKEKWSEASSQSTFNFINLSPANYTLKVKCFFPEERYPSQVISYSFQIDPPWWQTWWLRSSVIVLILGFVFMLLRIYFKRELEKTKLVLEKQQAVERERTRIATDMHDDLGAGLSRIKFLSETIGIKKQKEEPIEEDINKIRNYSHEMIDKMGEIVWALNEKNDSLSDLLSYTRSYAVEYLAQSGIRCEVTAPDTFPTDFVSGEFRRNIYLVVKEALHNIVKHAQANGVILKIITNHQLEIWIADDGVGFDRSNIRPFSNGLTNMEKRIAEIGGSLTIDNEAGTTIHITAPFKA